MYTYHGSTYVDNYLKIFKNSSFLGGYIKNEGEGRISWFTVYTYASWGGGGLTKSPPDSQVHLA